MQAKILIVEDEAITAMDIKRTLEMRGFEVVSTASRGEEAIQKARKLKPDLVLMDIILKGDMDGIEAADKIQTLFDIPVVYLTAHSDKNTFQRAKLTKPYGFITKPVNHDGLQGTIETSLYKHELDKKLKESEKLYYDFFDNPITGLALCEIVLDEKEPVDFVYLEVNKTFEVYTGLKREEVLNRRVTNVLVPEEVAEIIKIYGKVALTGEPVQFEYSIPSLGKIFNVAAFSPGKKYFIAIFTDITGQKETDKALKLSNEWLNLAQHATNAGFWDWDMSTDKLTWSEALYNLFDVDPHKKATFDIWFSIMNPDDHEMAMKNINSAIEEKKFLINEYRVIHSDGNEHWIRALGNTLYDDKGKPERMSGICLDITKDKQAELERETTIEFLRLVNESKEVQDLVQLTVTFFQQQSGFHAVGVRLKEGNDFPYFEARGFPEEFLEVEN
jgi:PAS domain S-box-containing protein